MSNKPIFKTDDGVEVFDGGEYFSVFTGGGTMWIVNRCKAYKETLDHCELRDDYKFFSTSKAASEYILLNKPCLSVSDISKAVKTADDEHFLSKLKYLAKSKL